MAIVIIPPPPASSLLFHFLLLLHLVPCLIKYRRGVAYSNKCPLIVLLCIAGVVGVVSKCEEEEDG